MRPCLNSWKTKWWRRSWTTWDQDNSGRDFQGYQEIGLDQYFTYFNVTSDYMSLTDHQWDYDNTPEATAQDYGRG